MKTSTVSATNNKVTYEMEKVKRRMDAAGLVLRPSAIVPQRKAPPRMAAEIP
jgi:hypothetical protein